MNTRRHVTVDICTKDRYFDTLPLTLSSIAAQTRTPDKVVIYDDSSNFVDIRGIPLLRYILKTFDAKGIKWILVPGAKRGQHIGHQVVQEYHSVDLVWRIDDDEVAEPTVLETLVSWFENESLNEKLGAVGGLVIMPDTPTRLIEPNLISDLRDNCQWYRWPSVAKLTSLPVEHLYSSYLYRKGVQNFDINLSPVAHREETLHSYGIFKKGYKLFVDSRAVTYHYRSDSGGIRTGKEEDWFRDEIAFKETMNEYDGHKVCYLDCGMGDHLVFKSILPKIKEKYKDVTLAVCYPELFPGEKCISLDEGQQICNPEKHNVFKYCIDKGWKDKEIKYAYAELYDVQLE